MSKHIHADIMKEYAEVAQTSDQPWEEFEFSDDGKKWKVLTHAASFYPHMHYRRKTKKAIVNGVEIEGFIQDRSLLPDNSKYYRISFVMQKVFTNGNVHTVDSYKYLPLTLAFNNEHAALSVVGATLKAFNQS